MRKLWAKLTAIGFALLVATPAPAPPPPPPAPDPALAEPIDGYNPQALFGIWTYHVEGKKSEAIDRLLAPNDDQPGLSYHHVIASFDRSADYGRFLAGRFEAHCRVREDYRAEPGSCVTVFRNASVRHDAADRASALGRWTRDRFDPPTLVRHLRAIGLPPETDWWRANRDRMFSALPSPVPTLVELGTVEILTEAQCPAMAAALAAIDKRPLAIVADLPGVGDDDAELWFPPPHSVMATDRIFSRDREGEATIEQTGRTSLLRPALNAVDTCLRDRRAD